MVYTHLSSAPPSTGSSEHPKILSLVYVIFFLTNINPVLISLQTTAVGSLLVGGAVNTVQSERPGVYTNEEIAKAISFLSGIVLIFLGLFRLGWLIELIPYVPISAFVTSASFTIIGTQLPVALGIRGIKTREAPYMVYINVLKNLPKTQLDAAIGLSSIVLLFLMRDVFAKMEVRQPGRKRLWAMLSSLRLTFTILLYTFISWIVHRKLPNDVHKFRLVGHIDTGGSLLTHEISSTVFNC